MLVRFDPDEYEMVFTSHTCHFHQANPGMTYAGCACSASSSQKLRLREEYLAIKAEKTRKEEDRILAEAEIIKARRKQQETRI